MSMVVSPCNVPMVSIDEADVDTGVSTSLVGVIFNIPRSNRALS